MFTFKYPILALALCSPLAYSASFNCAKASSRIEKMVCANPELSRQDDYLNGSYQRALGRIGNTVALRESQRDWLKSHTLNDCKTSDCVKLAYGTRVKLLDDAIKSPWNGHYVRQYQGRNDRNSAEIVLIASGEGGVAGDGQTMWLGPNAANGQINVGEFNAIGSLSGNRLTFKDDACQITATLKGARLKIEDNNMCGGMNATFSGEYKRKQ